MNFTDILNLANSNASNDRKVNMLRLTLSICITHFKPKLTEWKLLQDKVHCSQKGIKRQKAFSQHPKVPSKAGS